MNVRLYKKHEAKQIRQCEGYHSNIFTRLFFKVMGNLRKLEGD